MAIDDITASWLLDAPHQLSGVMGLIQFCNRGLQMFVGVSVAYVFRFEVSVSAGFVVVIEPDERGKIGADGDR